MPPTKGVHLYRLPDLIGALPRRGGQPPLPADPNQLFGTRGMRDRFVGRLHVLGASGGGEAGVAKRLWGASLPLRLKPIGRLPLPHATAVQLYSALYLYARGGRAYAADATALVQCVRMAAGAERRPAEAVSKAVTVWMLTEAALVRKGFQQERATNYALRGAMDEEWGALCAMPAGDGEAGLAWLSAELVYSEQFRLSLLSPLRGTRRGPATAYPNAVAVYDRIMAALGPVEQASEVAARIFPRVFSCDRAGALGARYATVWKKVHAFVLGALRLVKVADRDAVARRYADSFFQLSGWVGPVVTGLQKEYKIAIDSEAPAAVAQDMKAVRHKAPALPGRATHDFGGTGAKPPLNDAPPLPAQPAIGRGVLLDFDAFFRDLTTDSRGRMKSVQEAMPKVAPVAAEHLEYPEGILGSAEGRRALQELILFMMNRWDGLQFARTGHRFVQLLKAVEAMAELKGVTLPPHLFAACYLLARGGGIFEGAQRALLTAVHGAAMQAQPAERETAVAAAVTGWLETEAGQIRAAWVTQRTRSVRRRLGEEGDAWLQRIAEISPPIDRWLAMLSFEVGMSSALGDRFLGRRGTLNEAA